MPNTVINGVDLHWRLTGEAGDPLVLVHGSWFDHRGWDQIVPALAQSFRVLTYDRRGHGQSERLAAQGSVREDVADLRALIEHLDLVPAHILGNSFGGVIALRLASERAALFRSVLVHEPPLFGVLDDPSVQRLLQSGQAQTRAVIDLLEQGQMEAGARCFMETIGFGPGAWARLPGDLRDRFVFNAPTFLDEERDPESRTIELPRLATFSRPALRLRWPPARSRRAFVASLWCQGARPNKVPRRDAMPLVEVKVFEDELTPDQTKQLIERITDAVTTV